MAEVRRYAPIDRYQQHFGQHTQAFGCNNEGDIVGSYTNASGQIHGFFFNGKTFSEFQAIGESQTPAFNVQGTFVNGMRVTRYRLIEGDVVQIGSSKLTFRRRRS